MATTAPAWRDEGLTAGVRLIVGLAAGQSGTPRRSGRGPEPRQDVCEHVVLLNKFLCLDTEFASVFVRRMAQEKCGPNVVTSSNAQARRRARYFQS